MQTQTERAGGRVFTVLSLARAGKAMDMMIRMERAMRDFFMADSCKLGFRKDVPIFR